MFTDKETAKPTKEAAIERTRSTAVRESRLSPTKRHVVTAPKADDAPSTVAPLRTIRHCPHILQERSELDSSLEHADNRSLKDIFAGKFTKVAFAESLKNLNPWQEEVELKDLYEGCVVVRTVTVRGTDGELTLMRTSGGKHF